MNATIALVRLLKENKDYRRLFKGCSRTSAFRLRSQGWQFREELAQRGHVVPLDEVQDSLFELVRELLPETPGADFVTWAGLLCGDAMACLAERSADLSPEEKSAVDLSAAWEHNEEVNAACEAEDLAALRKALRSYERGAVKALARSREESGAA